MITPPMKTNLLLAGAAACSLTADSHLDLPFRRGVSIPFRQSALYGDGTLGRFQRAVELDQKRVADGLNLGPVKPRKDFAEERAMFFQQFDRNLGIVLR